MWHAFEMRAVQVGIWGSHPGGPSRLLDVDPTVFLAFAEGILREDEDNAAALDKHYEARRPKPKESRAERNARIERLARMTA